VRLLLRLLSGILLCTLSGSCTSPDPLPPWFDSFERIPLKSVMVNGRHIAYLDAGEGPPVVLIHGFGGSMWQWEYQQEALSAQVRVVTPDLLGAGLSDKPDIEYRPEQLLEFLEGFLDALRIRQATLVGNSMGAGLAIGMALDHPDRVTSLVLISGLPPHVLDNLANDKIRRALTTSMPAWLVSLGNRLVGGFFVDGILREIVHDPVLLTPAVLDRSNRNRQRPGLFGPLLATSKHLPIWETRYAPRIGTLSTRTLVIWGEEDRVFPIAVGRRLQAMIPGSAFVAIPQANHIPQWEQPRLVNEQLLRFLQP
jgi:pimeloyl-ACP methyl ester carboxylesterase